MFYIKQTCLTNKQKTRRPVLLERISHFRKLTVYLLHFITVFPNMHYCKLKTFSNFTLIFKHNELVQIFILIKMFFKQQCLTKCQTYAKTNNKGVQYNKQATVVLAAVTETERISLCKNNCLLCMTSQKTKVCI